MVQTEELQIALEEDPEDADRLRDSAYLGRVADGIAAGIQAAAAAMDEGAGVKEEP